MIIRKATLTDLKLVMPIFERAKVFMAQTGNPTQWIGGYPSEAVIANDIENGNLYIAEEDKIYAVFSLIQGPDPTYSIIENGSWLNDAPYHVVHRLAASGERTGMGRYCLEWCFQQCGNLRADTHADNRIMQHILLQTGFTPCGIIYCHNATPRLSYQRKK